MPDHDKIQDKLRKLLRLAADNPNVNEAAVAFAAAQELATRHSLDLDDILDDDASGPAVSREVGEIVDEYLDHWGKGVAWKYNLGGALAHANNCGVYQTTRWNASGLKCYGQQSDVETTRYLYLAIVKQIEAMAKRATKAYGDDLRDNYADLAEAREFGEMTPRSWGRNYRMGAVATVAKRIRDAAQVVEVARGEVEAARKAALTGAAGDLDEVAMARANNALVRVDLAGDYLDRVRTALEDKSKELKLRSGGGFVGAGGSGYAEGRRAGGSVNLGGARGSLKGGG